MAICLSCLGEGQHDTRDMDAMLGEHLPDELLQLIRPSGDWRTVTPCETCEGTGVISDELYAEMMAHARAAVDQIMAKIAEEASSLFVRLLPEDDLSEILRALEQRGASDDG